MMTTEQLIAARQTVERNWRLFEPLTRWLRAEAGMHFCPALGEGRICVDCFASACARLKINAYALSQASVTPDMETP